MWRALPVEEQREAEAALRQVRIDGSCRDQPLVREPQGDYEIRDELNPPVSATAQDTRA